MLNAVYIVHILSCRKLFRDHEIDSDIETPVRNHIKFPGIPKIVKPADYLKRKNKVLINKRKRDFDESFPDQPSIKAAKLPVKVRVQEEHARKFAVKSSSEQFVDKPEKKKPKVKDTSASSSRPANEQEKYLATSSLSTMGSLPQSSFPRVDSETEKRLVT